MAKKIKPAQHVRKPEKPEANKPSFNFLAFLMYFLLPLLFFSLPKNKVWLKDRVLTYYKDIPVQYDSLSINFRKAQRLGPAYSVFDFACKQIPKGSRFLMPPQTYFLKMLYDKNSINQLTDPLNFLGEPNVFSYHCMDLTPILLSMDEKTIRSAEYTVFVTPQKTLQLVKIENDAIYQQVRSTFDLPLNLMATVQEARDYVLSVSK